jgi:hypothetical protein
MGEAKRKRSATAAFIEQFPDCYFCGGRRRATTREHMPPKSLFDNSHRPDKLVVPACAECNRGTSTADLVASIVSRWNYSSSLQENRDQRRLIPQVRRQAPGIIEEWTTTITEPHEKERARQHLRNYGVVVPYDAAVFTIGPLTIRELNLFAHKAVLALHFEHFHQPLPMTGRICAYWKTKEDFAKGGIPQQLLAIMPKYGTLIQGKWDERQTFEYRHDSNVEYGLFGCLAKLRRGLFVAGFTVTDANVIVPDDNVDWISPGDPPVLLANPRFSKKF